MELLERSIFHKGIDYIDFLRTFHERFQPRSYLEIGIDFGNTLELATCPTIAIDPNLNRVKNAAISDREETHLFKMESDEFFARINVLDIFPLGIDLAFLDGLHWFEYLLRDFYNTERFSNPNGVVILHDCFPTNLEMTERDFRPTLRKEDETRYWWTGDVWKLLPILREYRPDLKILYLDCPLTGLVLIGNLNPKSRVLRTNEQKILDKYGSMTLEDYGFEKLRHEFPLENSQEFIFAEMAKEPERVSIFSRMLNILKAIRRN